ncbi:MAG: DUF47 family protein [Coriobacteriales bacterium]|jgi:uncharacterized protein Yka (UPF0111/DUF47 family)|nr:DUF47 family protein [Coriobacteriales bacterium]
MPKIKFNYFDAFERIAEYAYKEATMLNGILSNYEPEQMDDQVQIVHAIENEADEENHQIYKHLANEFVPPIEREDIVTLAHHLDNIVDYIDDVVQRLFMFNIQEIPEPALQMGELIEKACTALCIALKDFRNFKKSKTLDQMLISVNDYEEEADRLYFFATRNLFTKRADDPLYVMSWYHIMVSMERCVDATEDAATTVSTIIMKNT